MEISAYIPCFNNSKTILEASLSIMNQSYPVSEFFVIDDGSTDNSVRILQEKLELLYIRIIQIWVEDIPVI